MRIIEEEQLDFDDVSIQPKRSSLNSRSEVDLWRTFKWTSSSGNKHELTCKALMVANMATVGTAKMAKKVIPLGYLCALEKHMSFEDVISLYDELVQMEKNDNVATKTYTDKLAVTFGLRESDEHIRQYSKTGLINIINIDAPNGYCPKMGERVKYIRELFPEAFIIAGSVVTGDIVTDLIMKGANCIRAGICCGSVCITAQKTGVRRPIISMLMDCSDAAHNIKGYIMLDGGIRCPADWCKATIAGADLCMSGSIFAGTDEAAGNVVEKRYLTNEIGEDGKPIVVAKKFKRYFGMSTNYAQEHYFGGVKPYRTSEGREKLIPCTGKVEDVLQDYEGGIRSCMTYIGARDFKSIQRHGTLYKVRHQLNTKFENCENF